MEVCTEVQKDGEKSQCAAGRYSTQCIGSEYVQDKATRAYVSKKTSIFVPGVDRRIILRWIFKK
jgi:hypothetical protein